MKKTFTAIFLIVLYCSKVNAAIFTVNSTSDANTGAGNSGTLRYCITQANITVAKDTINFSIAGTLTVASNYPVISNPLVINGFSAPGAVEGQLGTGTRVMKIILNGPGNNTVYGFQFTASNSQISGLVIQNFYVGIVISGGSNDWIWGCYIGTASDALSVSAATTCYDDGIRLSNNATNNIIGTNGDGTNDANEGNCIGGNGDGGVQYLGECIAINEGGTISTDCTGNTIAGNYLGIKENGTAALYAQNTNNAQRGSGVQINYSTYNIIGTNADGVSDALERNIISGNSDAGVVLVGASNNKIKGNYIGTDKTGLVGVPNYGNGGTGMTTNQVVLKTNSLNNFVGTDGDGVRDNIEGNVIGSASVVEGGAGSYSDGIDILSGSTGNRISGNYIGIGSDGTTAVPILTTGIVVNDYAINDDANNNIIGTNGDGVSDAYEANYIGNSGTGIFVDAVTGTVIAGNYIGLATNLTTSESLGYAGVYTIDGSTIRIGSSASKLLERNYICNSSLYGIWIDGNGSDNNDLTNIRYNFIGLRPDSVRASNAEMGIYILNHSNADTIQYNRIAFNGTASATGAYPGIQIGSSTQEATYEVINNNTIYKNIGAGIAIIKKESKGTKISQNSIYNNGNGSNATGKLSLGIDLGGDGVTADDNKDADDGPDALSNFPVIVAAIKGGTACTQNVSGTFNGRPNVQYYVEVFSSDVCNGDTSGVDHYGTAGSNYGEGKTYEGASATFTTDGNGNANWTANITITSSTGMYLTATAIQMNGDQGGAYNTSEFSLCYTIKSDLGDAPDTYHTLLANCGPLHANAGPSLTIGATVTTEDDGQPSAQANLDFDDGISSFPTLTNQSTTYTLSNIPVVNSTGSTATLYAWIDFNRNGSFEASEFTSSSVANGATSANLTWNLSAFSCQSTIVAGVSYLRMRLTTTALADSVATTNVDERCYGLANDGEVEDYKLYISGYDYGDCPNTYPVAAALCLEDTATAKVWAGVIRPSSECSEHFSVDAYGDGAEEDGLTPAIGPSGGNYNWVVKLNANQANKTVYYGLWLDWDANSNFTSALDAFYSGSAVVNGNTSKNVSVYTPNGVSNSAFFRLIVSDNPVTSGMYNATITNGEVEDYSFFRILSSSENVLIGKSQNGVNILRWNNSSTLSIKNYSLQRSSDNISWSDIETGTPVTGDNSAQYSFADEHPISTNYYRMKLMLPDSNYQYSNIIVLTDKGNLAQVLIYPNPSSNIIHIQTSKSDYNNFQIIDLTGRSEITGQINSFDTPVDISKLPAGAHVVKLSSKDGITEIKKFVKAQN